MRFIKTPDAKLGVQAVVSRLQEELGKGKHVLWLLCGGSNIAAEVEILHSLKAASSIENLTIMLMDERYGKIGHPDSNWWQLQDGGANFADLNTTPVLTKTASTLNETVARYEREVQRTFETTDVIIGVFGIGTDGHTAGMLPNTPATQMVNELVVGYDSPPFQRITLTRRALLRVTAAYAFAFGESKAEALHRLEANQEEFTGLPAKLFWELPEVYVYNDQLGENA